MPKAKTSLGRSLPPEPGRYAVLIAVVVWVVLWFSLSGFYPRRDHTFEPSMMPLVFPLFLMMGPSVNSIFTAFLPALVFWLGLAGAVSVARRLSRKQHGSGDAAEGGPREV